MKTRAEYIESLIRQRIATLKSDKLNIENAMKCVVAVWVEDVRLEKARAERLKEIMDELNELQDGK